MAIVYSTELRTAQQVPITTIIGSGGKLKLYTSGDVLLITFILATPPAPTPVAGVWTASTIAPGVAVATGTATKATVTKSTDVVVLSGLTVGVASEDVVIDAASALVTLGDNMSVASFTITRGNA